LGRFGIAQLAVREAGEHLALGGAETSGHDEFM
jgi:hypothetical protein